MQTLSPWAQRLRPWQEQAFRTYATANKQDFLLVATPGAGKTIAAARIAHELFRVGTVERIVVLCPTEHLKKQWAGALAPFGLRLDPVWKNATGRIADDYHGIVATYAQIASNPDIHRSHCRVPTLLVADEIHHAGDDRSWGGALKEAFGPAARRLLLSGTPFRSDGSAIPFVTYYLERATEKIISKADFSYGYGQALMDGVCRPVLFPSYEGKMEWLSGLERMQATFRDELPEDEGRRRLRTALDPAGNWIRDVLRDADQRLTELRANGDPCAGGLVLCSDAAHARRVGETLTRVTARHEVAEIVLSEEDGSSERIAAFAKSDARWLIAVRMVSEGVDIPRLRVGVYATHWIAERFFRQAVGRFVRMVRDSTDRPTPEEQSAYLFIPHDPALVIYAEKIKEERDHELAQEIERARREASGEVPSQQMLYAPVAAEARADDVIFDQEHLSQAEIDQARGLLATVGTAYIPPEVLARILRLHAADAQRVGAGRVTTGPVLAAPPLVAPDPLHVQKEKLRRLIKRLVAQIVQSGNTTFDYSHVYLTLQYQDGVKQDQATLDQLQKRLEYLQAWHQRLTNEQQ